MKFYFVFLTAQLLTYVAQSQKSSNPDFDTIKLKAHVITLASDSFQGRKPFTIGETKTISYLTTVLKEMGLEPGNGKSFLQEVPVVLNNATVPPVMNVSGKKGELTMQAGID